MTPETRKVERAPADAWRWIRSMHREAVRLFKERIIGGARGAHESRAHQTSGLICGDAAEQAVCFLLHIAGNSRCKIHRLGIAARFAVAEL